MIIGSRPVCVSTAKRRHRGPSLANLARMSRSSRCVDGEKGRRMPRLSAKQLEQRRQGIGSSDVAAIVGASPWATAADIYYDKVDGITKPESEAMALGH